MKNELDKLMLDTKKRALASFCWNTVIFHITVVRTPMSVLPSWDAFDCLVGIHAGGDEGVLLPGKIGDDTDIFDVMAFLKFYIDAAYAVSMGYLWWCKNSNTPSDDMENYVRFEQMRETVGRYRQLNGGVRGIINSFVVCRAQEERK